jgi:hypothetical protein
MSAMTAIHSDVAMEEKFMPPVEPLGRSLVHFSDPVHTSATPEKPTCG